MILDGSDNFPVLATNSRTFVLLLLYLSYLETLLHLVSLFETQIKLFPIEALSHDQVLKNCASKSYPILINIIGNSDIPVSSTYRCTILTIWNCCSYGNAFETLAYLHNILISNDFS